MPDFSNLPSETMCAVITVTGTVLSAVISLIGVAIANHTAKRNVKTTLAEEVNKMKLTWEREDIVSSDDEFADMAATVAKFVQYNSPTHRSESMAKVAAARSKESGELGRKLDDLYDFIRQNNPVDADHLLTASINEKRKIKSQTSVK